jgi:peptidoglycan hydrolase-like protein with peptidoglycan-binding domain
MALLIPASTPTSLKEGASGAAAFAVQSALAALGYQLSTDGAWGPQTTAVVKEFQRKNGLTQDGVAGPLTPARVATRLVGKTDSSLALPVGLMQGFAQAEGGNYLAAVNRSVPGGVDCGLFQRRVLQADYENDAVVRRAFDGGYQRNLLASQLRDRRDAYYKGDNQKAWRLAALHHNYPYGAQQISDKGYSGLSSYWRTPQTWVTNIHARFPDGEVVQTPLEWCKHYALGAPEHNDPGLVTRNVTSWS